MCWQQYLKAGSVDEALKHLNEYEGKARVIAGGTDLIEQIRKGEKQPVCLIDISRNSETTKIELKEGRVSIGASVTHTRIVHSPEVQGSAPMLGDACGHIGSLQIRNVGTVGGNIVNSQPAADSVIALLALNAELTVLSSGGQRKTTLDEIFLGPGKCTIDSTRELLTEIAFTELGQGEGCAFARLARRKGAALPTLNAAVRLSVDVERKHIDKIRLFMGPVAPTPKRLTDTEQELISRPISSQSLEKALKAVESEVNPRDSLRGSGDYRRAMCPVLVRHCVQKALREAGWQE